MSAFPCPLSLALRVGERLGRSHHTLGLFILNRVFPKSHLLLLRYYTETGILEGVRGGPQKFCNLGSISGSEKTFFSEIKLWNALRGPILSLEGKVVL